MDEAHQWLPQYEAKVITTHGIENELTDRITREMRGGWQLVSVFPKDYGQVTVFMQRIIRPEPPKGET